MSSPVPAPAAGRAPAAPASSPSPPAKKKGFFRRVIVRGFRILLLLVLVLVALVAGLVVWILWFFPNGAATSFAIGEAKAYGIELGVGKLDVRPLHEVAIEKLSIDVPSNHTAGYPPLLTVGKIDVRWDVHDFLHRNARLLSVEVEAPHVHLESRNGKWNYERALADLGSGPLAVASPAATPVATPSSEPLENQLAAQSQQIDRMLAGLPVDVNLDHVSVRDFGVDVVTEAGTIATIDHAGADLAMHLPKGGPAALTVQAAKDPGIDIAIQPSGDAGFSGRFVPDVKVAMELPKKVRFDVDAHVEDGLLVAAGLELPVVVAANAHGAVDVPNGDVSIQVESLDLDHCVDAKGELSVAAVGTRGIHAAWTTAIAGDALPAGLDGKLASALSAKHLRAGAHVHGSIDGKVDSSDVAALEDAFAKGRFPLTLDVKSEGESEEDPIEAKGVKIGRVSHRAEIHVTHESVSVDSDATIARIVVPQVLGGKPFTIHLADALAVPASLDAIDLRTASVEVPEHGLRVEGHGRVAGINAALDAWRKGTTTTTGAPAPTNDATEKAALGALTALSEIRVAGRFDFDSKKWVEVAPGATIKGGIHGAAEIRRGKDPFGRLTADVRYDDFSARVASTNTLAEKTATAVEEKLAAQPQILHGVATTLAERAAAARAAAMTSGSSGVATVASAPATEDKPLLVLEGMTAHLVIDRGLILGGHPKLEALQIAADEAEMFDPATRGYYDRLGSLRADADNFRIERVVAGPLRITDLTAEVLYDGNAIHVNRGHMNLLGGEVVGRMIVRPTAEGVHFAMSGDASGIDMSPFLLDHPVADPNDTRVHVSSAASFFLSKDDPIGSLADARMRMDMTCAGSKVVDTVLAWLDPENKDPMYNWARAVNRKVVGLTRPQISSVADHGMYDVTIAFPSLGLSKDVRRIPLAPLLRLKFTQEMIGGFAPPGEMLPLLAARGIDADGNFLIPPIKRPED